MATKLQLARRKKKADRREKAFAMLAQGATDEMIVAADIGYKTVGDMREDLRVWRGTRVKREADGWFEKQMAVLERLLADTAIYDRTKASYEEKTARGALILKILERMARMTGTDAPKQVQVQAALLQLTAADLRGMTTTDIQRALETGQLPPQHIVDELPQGRQPLPVVGRTQNATQAQHIVGAIAVTSNGVGK